MAVNRVKIDIKELIVNAPTLILDSEAASGATSITVKSITGAAINQLLLFRDPGSERAEIIATHASSAPSGSTVTLVAAGLIQAHPAGTKVYIIRANKFQVFWAATQVDANAGGSVASLASAQFIDPTLNPNIYDDTVKTSGYYYYQFQDSVNSVNLNYSDGINWGQYEVEFDDDEVGSIMSSVTDQLKHPFDTVFSKRTFIKECNKCLRYIQGKLKRWPRHLITDYVLGQTSRGVFEFDLPTDMYDRETNKSVIQIRIGTSINPIIMKDEKEFDQMIREAIHTTVRTQPSVGATTLNITNSYDFSDTGTVHVFTSNTDDAITYTGVTRSSTTGILTGVPASGSGSIAATHAVGLNVWQGHTEGQPLYGNIRNGQLRLWPLSNATWVNKNVFLDYSKVATRVDSESDAIDSDRFDMVEHWMLWKAKAYWRNNGKLDMQDGDFIIFQDILKSAIRTSVSNQKNKMHPKLNTIRYHGTDRRFDFT